MPYASGKRPPELQPPVPPRTLYNIDDQLRRIWACYRGYLRTGQVGTVHPTECLLAIDDLLDLRLDIMSKSG